MTISTLTIDDINPHNGAMNDSESKNPEVLERPTGRRHLSSAASQGSLANCTQVTEGAVARLTCRQCESDQQVALAGARVTEWHDRLVALHEVSRALDCDRLRAAEVSSLSAAATAPSARGKSKTFDVNGLVGESPGPIASLLHAGDTRPSCGLLLVKQWRYLPRETMLS